MLQVNPSFVTDSLKYYIDVNNNRSYSWGSGSNVAGSLINVSEKLSGYNTGNFKNDGRRRFLNFTDSEDRLMTGSIQLRSLSSFTFQFWFRLKTNFIYNPFLEVYGNPVLISQSTNTVNEVYEITYEDDILTFEGDALTVNIFTSQPTSNADNSIAFAIGNDASVIISHAKYINPIPIQLFNTSDTFTLSNIDNKENWNLITISTSGNKVKVYKNLESKTFTSQSSVTLNLSGIYLVPNNYDIGHIAIYDRQLSDLEVFQNYNNFKSIYEAVT
jgi:hypothetical protein